MRFLILLFSISIFLCETAFAQSSIPVDEKVMPMSKGNQPGLEFLIHEANVSTVQSNWERFMRGANRPDILKSSDEIQAMNAIVRAVSEDVTNIYAKFTQLKGGTYGQVFFQYEDNFLSSKNDALKLAAAKKYVFDFAQAEYKSALQEKLKLEEARYKEIEREESRDVRTNDNIYKTISQEERKISQLRNDIRINESDQDVIVQQITSQKRLVIDFSNKSEDAAKSAQKELDSFENDYKKLKRDHERLHKSIDKSEQEIRKAERTLEMNKADLSRKQDELIQQKAVIEVLKEKIRNLR